MLDRTTLSAAQVAILKDQVIGIDEPGTVLRDFGMLLDFLASRGGVEAAGKYNMLPIKHIAELDRGLSHPLNLTLKRPLLRSHPYLQGLNLLLRASGLGSVEGAGSRARLVVDPAMRTCWDQLNPTEQYFHLFEAWLRFGREEMVGERGSRFNVQMSACFECWWSMPEAGSRTGAESPHYSYEFGVRAYYQLALMDLFGLARVEHADEPLATWYPAGVQHTPFGDAMLTVLFTNRRGGILGGARTDEEDEGEEDDGEWEFSWVPHFGAWQPLFQPYFPEWRELLEFEDPEPREGTFVFDVALGKVRRLIAMPAEATMEDLAGWILKSVEFDDDHLFEFTLRDPLGSPVTVGDARSEVVDAPANLARIGTLPLEPGQTMDFLFDFGDCWKFTIKLERIEPPGAKIKAPHILKKTGRAPAQYPNWDD